MATKRLRRFRCWLGLHDWRADPDVPHTYWCARPLCPAVTGGHP